MQQTNRSFFIDVNDVEIEGTYDVWISSGDCGVRGSLVFDEVESLRLNFPVVVDGVDMEKEELTEFLGPLQMTILGNILEEHALGSD